MNRNLATLLIFVFAMAAMFFATKLYRSNQVLNLQNQVVTLQVQLDRQNQFITNTRNALIRSNLNQQMVQGFNQLGWNIPIEGNK